MIDQHFPYKKVVALCKTVGTSCVNACKNESILTAPSLLCRFIISLMLVVVFQTTTVSRSQAENAGITAIQMKQMRTAIGKCWNVGMLSSTALRVSVNLRVEMDESGKPKEASIEMISFEGGSAEDAAAAFKAAKRAIMRCAGDGYDLPPAEYEVWRVLSLVFDVSGMAME